MTKQRSWCCGFIPRFWWWFLALLGLPLLFALMTYFHQGVVEGDLTARVSQALSAENLDWAEVDVQRRGRDVLLAGTPPNDSERSRALEVARSVYGVNRADFVTGFAVENPGSGGATAADNADSANNTNTPQTTSESEPATEAAGTMPTLNVAQQDGKLLLAGSLPSQQEIDGLVRAAEQRFGKDNVNNQLVVGDGVATPEWLTSARDVLSVMPGKDAALNISAQGIELAGEVNQDSDKQTLLSRAQRLFGNDITDKIVVKKLLPPEVEMALAAGKLTLSGNVASQEEADTILQIATVRAGAGNVINQLTVSEEYADAAWMGSAQQVFSNLLPENGSAKITNGSLEINAEVASEAEREQLLIKSDAFLEGSGLTLVNNISLAAEKPADTAENDTPAVDPEAAILACQEKLDAAMQDKNILFRVNKADIRNESHALLDELAAIVTDCKDALTAKQVVIGGHTDSDGSEQYNLQLSQRRADAVRTYLTGKGVAAGLLSAKGFGESQPVASNDSAAGKARNRRISFEIQAAE